LIEEIKEITVNNVSFVISKICKTISGNGAQVVDELTPEDFFKVENDIKHLLIENKIRKPLDFLPKNRGFSNCYAGSDNGFVINYDGAIYKCFGDVNPPQNKAGQLLSNGEISFLNEQYFKWGGYDFYENLECRNCILLPTCMGGCVKNKLGLTSMVTFDSNIECDRTAAIGTTKELIKQCYLNNQTT